MGMLQSPMISALPGSPAAALLAREDQSRREGSGIQIEQPPGCWMLQQTWTRSGDAPAPGTAPLLRWRSDQVLLQRSLPSPEPQRLPFFALIELNEQQGTLTARGRGGGLAQWSRKTQEAS